MFCQIYEKQMLVHYGHLIYCISFCIIINLTSFSVSVVHNDSITCYKLCNTHETDPIIVTVILYTLTFLLYTLTNAVFIIDCINLDCISLDCYS